MSKTVRLLALLLVIGCAHFADGQGVGVITGAVTDEQGTAISGVSVTAHGFDQSEIVKSDATGKFTLPPLMPGRYVVTAALDGFGTEVRSGVMVRIGKTARLPLILKVVRISEEVSVTAPAPAPAN